MARYKTEEEELLIYFNRDKILKELNKQLAAARKALAAIKEELSTCSYIDIEENLGAQQYTERVQSAPVGHYVDNIIERQTDLKLQEQEKIERDIETLLDEIERVESLIRVKEWEVNSLNTEDKTFLEKRYKKNMSQQALALEMYLDQANISRKQQKILKGLSDKKIWNFTK